MLKILVTRIACSGVADKAMRLTVTETSEEEMEEIVAELDALVRQGVRELRHQGHKISIS